MPKSFSQAEREKLRKDRDILPPLSDGPFGPFPANFNTSCHDKAKATVNGGVPTTLKKKTAAGQSAAAAAAAVAADTPKRAQVDVLIGHTGIGGMTVSTFKGTGAAKTSRSDGRFGDPAGPGEAGAYAKQRIPPTEFRHHYERGDLPLSIQHAAKRSLMWKVDMFKLDYHHYLPIFFDGLRELEEPFNFVAYQGSLDLLEGGGVKILPTVPQLIMPLKTALNTRHPDVLRKVFQVIQKLVVSGDHIGEALVPYYRQLLPVFNLFKNRTRNMGDRMDYGQRSSQGLSSIINDTLCLLERYGGPDAYINIKYMIPTYESCM
ncbi:parkin co-regulated gene (PACRGB) protein [Leptomonas seymouri]|uniref:Parkin co-regulated gene (PACRGB) protein n=1 Tax=Leptomonas seymouri TaxID=5684 RepID=A0A0N0P9H6_LEPSE|nr:parkin co-regulated gene (PACRGB) protein [Leptomonas seymouri]|eukprot:KPI90737.1 parkin co-regulated gene (PACRGB) protein [Leptomonas seymouri]